MLNTTFLKEKNVKPRKKRKTYDDNLIMLIPGEQYQLCKRKYTVPQLKYMCKHYQQRTSGNKDVLIQRLHEYLLNYIPARKIQELYKKHLLKKYIFAKGPAFIKRSICVNETDFFTMEPIQEINIEEFVSFEDKDKMIYGFNIISLYNIWLKCPKPYRNPYNRNIFPLDLKKKCDLIHKFSKSFFNGVNVDIDTPEPSMNETNRFELEVLNIFQEINALGNYTDHTWFLSLSRHNLIRFIREIVDIWSYRADLTFSVKQAICPPNGNPFLGLQLNTLQTIETLRLQQMSISIIRSIVLSARDTTNRSLGAYYVLGALTLVSQQAALSLPWLYQSVVYD